MGVKPNRPNVLLLDAFDVLALKIQSGWAGFLLSY